MSQPKNTYARRARADMEDARKARAEIEERERQQSTDPDAKERRQRAMERRAKAFDALQVGDILEPFGIAATVKKKNRQSVITGMGTRWTREELTGIK